MVLYSLHFLRGMSANGAAPATTPNNTVLNVLEEAFWYRGYNANQNAGSQYVIIVLRIILMSLHLFMSSFASL
jgi:hypothetical protein